MTTPRDVTGDVPDRHFRWSAVTIDCLHPTALASFWATLLGGEVTVPLPGWRRLAPPGNAPTTITFQPVAEPKRGKTRIHLDLEVDDLAIAQQQIVRIGGRASGQRYEYAEGTVVVMADPEGNEFCIVRYTT